MDSVRANTGGGSSPRVRGTCGGGGGGYSESRFIPAGAGNIPGRDHRFCSVAVHPRGCGEHIARKPWPVIVSGSSPRVRGTSPMLTATTRTQRFIPAGAGNISSTVAETDHAAVHPRGCGEHCGFRMVWISLSGSSPRVRGTFQHSGCILCKCRFIPAGAGNILCACFPATTTAVHPRGCGEHSP